MIGILKSVLRPRSALPIRRWLRSLGVSREDHPRVTVYTRANCSCCEKAKAVIEPRRRRHGFAVEEVDIDGDQALVELYGTSVPVVAIDGKIRFRGKVDPALLDRLLEAEARRRAGG